MVSGRTALVLGASGMVGEPLARALLADGWQVHGAARFRDDASRETLEGEGVRTHRFDVLHDDPRVLPDVETLFLEIWDPRTRPLDDAKFVWALNYFGVGRVVERYAGVADIVNGCTINVYGDNAEPASELTPCRPTSEYGHARCAQERLIDYFCVRGVRRGIHVRYAHANAGRRGVLWKMGMSIARGESLGPHPDSRIQVIALEDFVRVTKEAAARVATPPAVVNCCHPRVWSIRELAEALHAQLKCGTVRFDRPSGGLEHSAYACTERMIEWFGEPRVAVEELLARSAREVLAAGSPDV